MNVERLIVELTRDEGVRLKPYRCPAGKITIGVGRNLEDVGISHDEADFLLRNDIARVEQGLDERLPWWRELDDVRQRAVANLAFNLGVEGLLKFRRTLDLLEHGNFLEAAQAVLASKYARQVGPRALRVASMIRDGGVA